MLLRCPHCGCKSNASSEVRPLIVRSGFFVRKSDSERLQRYSCKCCDKTFSVATTNPCYLQKKRHLNQLIFKLLVSGTSQRRAAFLLNTNRKTIVRKFLFLGACADQLFSFARDTHLPSLEVEFDDLETFEHSKLKPLSVIMAVESKTRRILGFRVARMPAKGLLVKRSLKKYGYRKDERKAKREELFRELTPYIHAHALIRSDENPHYPSSVRKFFPQSVHEVFKGRRGCVVGQGELKGGGFDPLFSLNHSFAMTRANINRLFRRTWNTTKIPERLAAHLQLYVLYHNLFLITDGRAR